MYSIITMIGTVVVSDAAAGTAIPFAVVSAAPIPAPRVNPDGRVESSVERTLLAPAAVARAASVALMMLTGDELVSCNVRVPDPPMVPLMMNFA